MVGSVVYDKTTGDLISCTVVGHHQFEIETLRKSGMSIYTVFGKLDGKPCHWTSEGKYRMDDIADHRDIPVPLRRVPEPNIAFI